MHASGFRINFAHPLDLGIPLYQVRLVDADSIDEEQLSVHFVAELRSKVQQKEIEVSADAERSTAGCSDLLVICSPSII